MSSNPTARIVATLAALAVVLAGLLPVAHLHADDGPPLVHRHLIGSDSHHHDSEADDHHQLGFDHANHADHSAAQVLITTCEHARPFALMVCPVVVSGAVVGHGAGPVAPPSGRTLLPTHDPPLRFTSSPAPPAVV